MSAETQVTPPIIYAIGPNDQLIEVDDAWVQFAEQNDAGQHLRPESVIGQSLWTFVRDETLRAIYRQLLQHVREKATSVSFDYRCDSPQFRRYMRMTISSRDDGGVQFHSATKAIARRTEGPRVASAFAGLRFVTRCSICNLYKLADGHWVDVATAVEHDVLNSDQRPQILWAVCRDCQQRLARNAVSRRP